MNLISGYSVIATYFYASTQCIVAGAIMVFPVRSCVHLCIHVYVPKHC